MATTVNVVDVPFYQHTISTTVTNEPLYVDNWINETLLINRLRLDSVIVGLDIEWRPNVGVDIINPVATLQLCVDHRCLIFQFLHSPYMPISLANFLNNPSYTFYGVGIDGDVEKLVNNYMLVVRNTAGLRSLAAHKYGMPELMGAGLKELTLRILGMEVDKPREITLSNWDDRWLTVAQVHYACLDAFLSSQIGMVLIFGN